MALPTPVTKQHMDEAGDDPKLARAELAALADALNALLTHLGASTITSTPLTIGETLEAAAGALRVKLDGTTLARSASGLKLNVPVSIASGGTGATTAGQARSNLGLANTAKTDQANTFTGTQTFEGSAMVLDTQGSSFTIRRGNTDGNLFISAGSASGDGGNIALRDGTAGNDIRFRQDTNVRAVIAEGVQVGSPAGGDPGAGKINAQGYQVNGTDVFPVGQAGLKTTTGTVSVSDGGGGAEISDAAAPGGQYGFCPEGSYSGTHSSHSGRWAVMREYSGVGTVSMAATIYIEAVNTSGSGTSTVTARQRYVQSSPPYDHGDGPVRGYVYAAMRPDGTVASTYIAEDPPWYGNTAHAPREQFIKDGKPFGRFVRPVCRLCDVKAGKITLDEYMARAGEREVIEEEITPATKLRGMEDLPQPFLTVNPDRTVVLLDPMDDLTGRLIAMMQAGESVPELFAEGYLRVDNEALKRGSPPGVPVHPVRWR